MKHRPAPELQDRKVSRPARGAWIETFALLLKHRLDLVAPRAGRVD